MRALRQAITVVAAACVVLSVYLVASMSTFNHMFWSPDSGSKLLQLLTLDATGDDPLPYLGRRIDPDHVFFPHLLKPSHPDARVSELYPRRSADGEVRFHWPSSFPALSLPFYRLFGMGGLYWIPLIGGALVAWLSGWLAGRFAAGAGPWVTLIVGLAGPVCFYSLLFWEHTPATLLTLLALWQALRAVRGDRPALLLATLALAAAAALRLETLLFGVAMLVAACGALLLRARDGSTTRRSRRLALGMVAALGLLALAALALVPAGRFGDKERDFAAQVLDGVADPSLWLALPARIRDRWIHSRPEDGTHVPEWVAWAGFAGALLCLVSMFPRKRSRPILFLAGASLVGASSAWALVDPIPYRAVHSLLQPAPYLVFALPFVRCAWDSRRPEARFVMTTAFAYLGLGTLAMAPGIHGGLEWGTRYLLSAYPLATLCAAAGVTYLWRVRTGAGFRIALALLAAWLLLIGVGFQRRGVGEIRRTRTTLAAYDDVLRDAPGAIVTDVYWLPLALTALYVEREFFTLATRDELHRWLRMADGKVDRFVFVGFEPLEQDLVARAPIELLVRGRREVHGMVFTELEIVRDAGFSPW